MEIKSMRFIWLYRNFLFKFVTFKTKDRKLDNVVKALNIKKRKDRINYIYGEAIKEINEYYSDDLCQFKNNQCIVQRENKKGGINGCCRICPLATNNGCPSVNISCKLVYCKKALGNLKVLKINDIKILKCLSLSQRLILKGDFFATKEQVINDLYYGIVFYAFRICIKDLKKLGRKF